MAPEFGKPIHQLPLISANILKKHCVHEPLDPRFRSAARLLQALWREDRDLPIGSYVNEDGKRRKLGSRIPLQQFWREHLLAQSMIANGLYDEGYLVVIAPGLNYHVQDAAEAYQAQLREPEDGKVRFVNLTLEDVIEVIRLSDQAHAEALHRRYCDFWLVDGELELNVPRFGAPAKRPARKPATARLS